MAVPTSCTVCNKPDAKRCARCGAACYCSQECQKKDWTSHKLLCKDFKTFSDEHRPSSDHLRAILFRVGASNTGFIWMKFTEADANEDVSRFDCGQASPTQVDGLLATPAELKSNQNPQPRLAAHRAKKQSTIKSGETVHREVELWVRFGHEFDGSVRNKGWFALTKAYGQPAREMWRGSIVVLAIDKSANLNRQYVDIDLDHFRMAVEYTFVNKGKVQGSSLHELMQNDRPHPPFTLAMNDQAMGEQIKADTIAELEAAGCMTDELKAQMDTGLAIARRMADEGLTFDDGPTEMMSKDEMLELLRKKRHGM